MPTASKGDKGRSEGGGTAGATNAMGPRLTPTFLLFAVALLLWSGSVSLSEWLGAPEETRHAAIHRGTAQPNAEVQQAQRELEQRPGDPSLRLQVARAFHAQATAERNNELLMDAVKAYQSVFEVSPEHPDALKGLATLCLEAGIIDEAVKLYPRYLAKRPDDVEAKTDYALTLVQAGKGDEAIAILKSETEKPEAPFQSFLALALAYKLQQQPGEARRFAEEARRRTNSEEAQSRIDGFIASLEGGTAAPAGGAPQPADAMQQLSPARVVSDFFAAHPIIGPKLRGVTWPSADRAKVAVENFPVEQMPPFAREKFLGTVRERLSILPERITVALHDAESDRELLTIEVGGQQEK